MTKRFKKDFNQLTQGGQTARLKKYEEERAERGTKQFFGRLTKDSVVKDIAGDAKACYIRVASNKDGETEFKSFSAYIAPDKVGGELESFYAGLTKGTLVSIEYKENGEYNNAYSIFKRQTK